MGAGVPRPNRTKSQAQRVHGNSQSEKEPRDNDRRGANYGPIAGQQQRRQHHENALPKRPQKLRI